MSDDTTTLSTDEQEFADELGELAFEGALIQYLSHQSEAEQEAFEKYIEEHIEDETFLEDLCERYPTFEKLLINEMRSIKDEFDALASAEEEGNSQSEL